MNTATIVVISDRHVGSTTGLLLGTVVLKDKKKEVPTPFQEEVAEFWKAFWKRRVEKDLVVLDLGDKIDGRHHDSTQIWGTVGDHVDVVQQMDMPIRRKAKRMYSLNGTPVHVGAQGDSDWAIAKEVGYDKLYGRWSNYHIRVNVAGVLVDAAHQGPSVGRREWNRENQLRLYVKSILMVCIMDGRRPPKIILRAHRHRKVDVLVDVRGTKCLGFITPSWQLKTEHANVNFTEDYVSDIGGLVIKVERGEIIDWWWDCMDFDEITEATA